MARQDILLIGLEYNSLRILEVSLRKAGFMVASIMNYSDAIEQIKIAAPDLVIIDSVKDSEAFEFAARLKNQFKNLPVILISSNKEINTRIRALEIGIDDYLIKPIYIKEIIARVKIHLTKKEQQRVEEGITAGFIGSLSDIGLYDIIQTIELNKKSGILEIKGKVQDGRIFFKNGQIVQANVGKLRGEYAIYRMLTFNEGIFKMSFLDIDVEPEITKPNSALIMEGMRRLDEYMKFTEQLPPLTTRLDVDTALLSERLRDIPDNVNSVLRLVDSERSINDIIEMSELDELETLKIISALYFDGIVYDIFAKKPVEKEVKASTLPEPVIEPSVNIEKAADEVPKKSPTSELWAENVFVKEKDVQDTESKGNIGEYTISDLANKDAEKEEKKQSTLPDVKMEKEIPSKPVQEEVPKEAHQTMHKESEVLENKVQSQYTGVRTDNIIVPENVEASQKDRLIENTLIENVTLSTSSYVKGSLLGKKEKGEKKGREKSSISIFVWILVILIILAGGYRGYKFYLQKTRLMNKTTTVTEKKIESKESIKTIDKVSEKVALGTKESKTEESKSVESENKIPQKEPERKEEEKVVEKKEEKPVVEDKAQIDEQKKGKQVVKREPEPEIDMDGYLNLFKSAQELYKSGNLKGAKEELKRALIKNPKGFEAFTLLGQIDLDSNRVKSAITYLKKSISYNNKYALAYFYLGTCYQLEGNSAEAKKMYQRYLNLAPNGEFANDVRAIISDLK